MKKRNIIAFLLLCIITCGIYELFWLYKTRLALVAKNNDPKSIPPLHYIFLPLLALLVVAIIQFWIGDNHNTVVTIFNVLSALLGIGGFVTAIVMSFVFTYRFSLVSSTIFGTHDGSSVFWLWILGDILFGVPIGPVLVQSHMNQYLDQQSGLEAFSMFTKPPTAPTV
jgi:hypothetical protein